jgi:hypothetical protein
MLLNAPQRIHRRRRTALVRIAIGALVSVFAVPVTVGITAATASAVVPNPTVTGPIIGGCSPSCPSPPGPASGIHIPDMFGGQSTNPNLARYGYVESEYFFEGTATALERDPTAPAWTSTGQWTARPKNHGKYVSPFVQATNDLRKAGFLLDPDAEELKTLAAESDVP